MTRLINSRRDSIKIIRQKTAFNWDRIPGSTIMEIILWDFLMFYQISLSPQVKQSTSNKQGVYELPHELPKNWRLKILGNKEKSEKSQNLLEW